MEAAEIETSTAYTFKRIKQAILYLQANMAAQPTLDEVAEHVALSPFHFQRLFVEWAGVSPKQFLAHLTAQALRGRLATSLTLAEAGEAVGLDGANRVRDLFVRLEHVAPEVIRAGGKGLMLLEAQVDTPFGPAWVAGPDHGVTDLHFLTDEGARALNQEQAQAYVRQRWPNATFMPDTGALAQQVLAGFAHKEERGPLRLRVAGTAFQLKVWQALLQIPDGQVASYQQIAQAIGAPKAMQAVGNAVGANPIGYLIPCHRVIRSTGVLGDYRWGAARKQAMLGREMAL